MADRPILFSAPMVRAIIAEVENPGTGKTQTRRLASRQDIFLRNCVPFCPTGVHGEHRFVPRFDVGDRLWVRETFALECCRDAGWYDPPHSDGRPLLIESTPDDGRYWTQPHYRATDKSPELDIGTDEPGVRWKPGIHMPRWASRLTLHVAGVKVERLQDISEADAKAEGIEVNQDGRLRVVGWRNYLSADSVFDDKRESFKSLWNSINGDREGALWSANPWVVAITFRPVLANIDTPAARFLEAA